MHIRELMQATWHTAGLYESSNVNVQAYLKYVADHPELGGVALLGELREHHYEVFGDFVTPLLASQDKLLRLAVIRSANPKNRKELIALKNFVQTANPVTDEPELLAIIELDHKSLTDAISKRTDLTAAVRRKV